MLRLGKSVRLTQVEIDRLNFLTGFMPVGIKHIEDFESYINECKRHYWGVSAATQFLHRLIDEEAMRCIAA